ncbi:TPA: phage tail tape measure protein [Citrobacter freundii]|nr:phage tail tape measure protein [Citrobacter freundii]HED3520354.1 phage tail tape measure protein [Citrobacter freundii]HED3525659.1 phage tail tape measure protein [Citrobacter freundii]HED3594102.1 phage tail tape measure protein [Citrobacter freundii]
MARNLQLALSLLARDGASKVLKQAMQDIIKQTRATQKAGDEQAKSQQQNTSSAIRASRTLQDEYRRASSARSSLGIRSEREIQREIQQTQAAYNRLTRAGTMSANEQNRAFRAMTERVSKLRTELVGTSETMTRMQRMRVVGTTATAVVGGVVAAGAMLAQPVTNQMDYRSRLAMMANTAYAERGLAGRREGMNEMDTLIRSSVRTGGGSKESAAETLDSMLASGAVSMTSAKTMLPLIQKYSTATGAAPTDLANIAIKLKQSFGIKDEDLEKALNMAISAGQSGSFELKDMAKWLPSQLASASNAGMKGLDDFSVLLGWNQASAITAGSSDQAGNNLNNLLLKLNSQDASNAAARIKMPNGKGIDLSGSLAKGVGKGINPLDAFNQIVDRVVASNPAYKKLEDKLKNATGTERANIINSQAKILEGSGIGKIIADQQALLALLGYRGNKGYTKDVIADANAQRKLAPGQTAGDINFSLMSEQSDFKVNQLKNEKDFAEMNSVSPLADALGDASEKLTKYAQEYPELTTALSGATTAIKAMSAAAIAFAGLSFLTGGGVKLPGGIKLPGGGTGGGGVLGRTWGAISRSGGLLTGRIAGPLAAAYAAYDLNNTYDDARDDAGNAGMNTGEFLINKMKERDKNKKPLFDIDPGKAFSSWWSSPSTIGQADPATTGVPSYLLPQQQKSQPFIITTKVMLDQREIAQSVNEFNGEQANRGSTGGPQ